MKEGGPLEHYKKFTEDKDNKELVHLLLDALSDEIFIWGGKGWNVSFRTLHGGRQEGVQVIEVMKRRARQARSLWVVVGLMVLSWQG